MAKHAMTFTVAVTLNFTPDPDDLTSSWRWPTFVRWSLVNVEGGSHGWSYSNLPSVVEGAAPGDLTITIKVPITWEWVKARAWAEWLAMGLILIMLMWLTKWWLTHRQRRARRLD